DGLTDLQELTRAAGESHAPTNPFLADHDGDGLLDGQETDSDPLISDTDGDGFKDGEDRWPLDGRRGDYIPAKFYSVTDLTEYIPENIRGYFEATHVAIDDNHNVGFAGSVTREGEGGGETTIYSYRWSSALNMAIEKGSFLNYRKEPPEAEYS